MKKSIQEFWRSLDLEAWLSSMGLSYSVPVHAALCFGSGFAIGFLFKKYFKFFTGATLFSLCAIKLLEYNGVLVIDWTSLTNFFGLAPHTHFDQIITTFFEWIKRNILVFISSIVGFLLGCKLG